MTLLTVTKKELAAIPSLCGAGVDDCFDLWDHIVASEFFPAGTESAFYVLKVSKPVASSSDVYSAKAELAQALRYLALAWPFSGGSFMLLSSEEMIETETTEDNFGQVESDLLRRQGLQEVSASSKVNYESLAGYYQAPLRVAVQIAKALHGNGALAKLMEYFNAAWIDYYCHKTADSWFIKLYKVREALTDEYGSEAAARSHLGISKNDWRRLGGVLNNNDLRHADTTANAKPPARSEVDTLFALVRAWVNSNLKKNNCRII
jgi:hypothetical protein